MGLHLHTQCVEARDVSFWQILLQKSVMTRAKGSHAIHR
jgi:hypothetical protein